MKVKLRIEIEDSEEDPEGSSMDLALSINDAEEPLDAELGGLIARAILGIKHRLCSPEETLANAMHVIYDEIGYLSEDKLAFFESAQKYLDGLAKLRARGA